MHANMIFIMVAFVLFNSCFVHARTKAVVSPVVNPLPDSEPDTPESEVSEGMTEGDMDLGENDGSASNRNALKDERTKWPNGEVCYFFEDGAGQNNPNLFDYIDFATKAISDVSCVTFRRMDVPTKGCIQVTDKRSGCSATVGHVTYYSEGSYQGLQLSKCCAKGSTIHELLHALGFKHEQSRPDRDEHVKVNFDIIKDGYERNFDKYTSDYVTTLNEPYDYGSILHYSAYGFSTTGGKTIQPIPDSSISIGQRRGMSELDIKKLNKHYNCGPIKPRPTAAPGSCECSMSNKASWCEMNMEKHGEEICSSTISDYCEKSCCQKNNCGTIESKSTAAPAPCECTKSDREPNWCDQYIPKNGDYICNKFPTHCEQSCCQMKCKQMAGK